MKPLRVITPGMQNTFPLRMLAAGARDNVGLVVMVMSESRMEADSFQALTLNPAELTWDWDAHISDYVQVREQWLSQGPVFLTNYARHSRLLFESGYTPETATYKMIAEDFYAQGLKNQETDISCDQSLYTGLAQSTKKVVNVCAADPMNCGTPGPNEIDSRSFACGKLDDLALALTGLHPANVWLTRMEANLPVSALNQDLVLQANASEEIGPEFNAQLSKGNPCALVAPMLEQGNQKRPSSPLKGVFMMGLLVLGAGAIFARRMTRRPAFITLGAQNS